MSGLRSSEFALGVGWTCALGTDMVSPFVSRIRLATSAVMAVVTSPSSPGAAGRGCGSGRACMPHSIFRPSLTGIA